SLLPSTILAPARGPGGRTLWSGRSAPRPVPTYHSPTSMNAPDPLLQHLADLGIERTDTLYYNLSPARLYEIALRRGEGRLAAGGPLVVRTDPHTGRSPKDRFVVREPGSEGLVGWGKTNVPVSEETFDRLLAKMGTYAAGRDLFVRDCFAGA